MVLNDSLLYRLRELYGLNPNATPLALQFPRLPPGLISPMAGSAPRQRFKSRVDKLGPRLEDFKDAYQRHASGLVNLESHSMILPGHPLHSGQNSIDALNAENNKLKKENFDLKKQLDRTAGEKTRHGP